MSSDTNIGTSIRNFGTSIGESLKSLFSGRSILQNSQPACVNSNTISGENRNLSDASSRNDERVVTDMTPFNDFLKQGSLNTGNADKIKFFTQILNDKALDIDKKSDIVFKNIQDLQKLNRTEDFQKVVDSFIVDQINDLVKNGNKIPDQAEKVLALYFLSSENIKANEAYKYDIDVLNQYVSKQKEYLSGAKTAFEAIKQDGAFKLFCGVPQNLFTGYECYATKEMRQEFDDIKNFAENFAVKYQGLEEQEKEKYNELAERANNNDSDRVTFRKATDGMRNFFINGKLGGDFCLPKQQDYSVYWDLFARPQDSNGGKSLSNMTVIWSPESIENIKDHENIEKMGEWSFNARLEIAKLNEKLLNKSRPDLSKMENLFSKSIEQLKKLAVSADYKYHDVLYSILSLSNTSKSALESREIKYDSLDKFQQNLRNVAQLTVFRENVKTEEGRKGMVKSPSYKNDLKALKNFLPEVIKIAKESGNSEKAGELEKELALVQNLLAVETVKNFLNRAPGEESMEILFLPENFSEYWEKEVDDATKEIYAKNWNEIQTYLELCKGLGSDLQTLKDFCENEKNQDPDMRKDLLRGLITRHGEKALTIFYGENGMFKKTNQSEEDMLRIFMAAQEKNKPLSADDFKRFFAIFVNDMARGRDHADINMEKENDRRRKNNEKELTKENLGLYEEGLSEDEKVVLTKCLIWINENCSVDGNATSAQKENLDFIIKNLTDGWGPSQGIVLPNQVKVLTRLYKESENNPNAHKIFENLLDVAVKVNQVQETLPKKPGTKKDSVVTVRPETEKDWKDRAENSGFFNKGDLNDPIRQAFIRYNSKQLWVKQTESGELFTLKATQENFKKELQDLVSSIYAEEQKFIDKGIGTKGIKKFAEKGIGAFEKIKNSPLSALSPNPEIQPENPKISTNTDDPEKAEGNSSSPTLTPEAQANQTIEDFVNQTPQQVLQGQRTTPEGAEAGKGNAPIGDVPPPPPAPPPPPPPPAPKGPVSGATAQDLQNKKLKPVNNVSSDNVATQLKAKLGWPEERWEEIKLGSESSKGGKGRLSSEEIEQLINAAGIQDDFPFPLAQQYFRACGAHQKGTKAATKLLENKIPGFAEILGHEKSTSENTQASTSVKQTPQPISQGTKQAPGVPPQAKDAEGRSFLDLIKQGVKLKKVDPKTEPEKAPEEMTAPEAMEKAADNTRFIPQEYVGKYGEINDKWNKSGESERKEIQEEAEILLNSILREINDENKIIGGSELEKCLARLRAIQKGDAKVKKAKEKKDDFDW